MTDKNVPGFEYKKNKNDNSMVLSTSTLTKLSFYIEDITNGKVFSTLVKNVEKMIRTSSEYSKYIGILKNKGGLTKDVFMPNIDIQYMEGVDFELHHYPFNLYEVVQSVILKFIKKKEMFSSFKIASDVMKLHYDNKIGLVPLTKTNHELAHANKLFIPLTSVFGDYVVFFNEYDKYFTNSIKEKIKDIYIKTEKGDYDNKIISYKK